MLVDKQDGSCRECQGQLEITDADDCSMTVFCMDCGESYDVETDAFGDGCVTYYFEFFMRQRDFLEDDE